MLRQINVNLGVRVPQRRSYAGVMRREKEARITPPRAGVQDGGSGFGPLEPGDNDRAMTVVKINAITVREGSGDELARRFANRAGAVDDADGFEGFELMRPNDDRGTWLVITRWRDEDSFNAWVSSPAFAHGHRGPSERAGTDPDGATPPPVGTHSELWSYEVVDLPRPA
jgi:heme-degrading monooxygenase HmoA